MPSQEAFELLVGAFFPVLAQEVNEVNELFLGAGAGASCVDFNSFALLLLSGISECVESMMIDTVRPSKALSCLSMIGTTLHWQKKLRNRAGGAPVCDVLVQYEQKLRATWHAYIAERVAAIHRCVLWLMDMYVAEYCILCRTLNHIFT